MPVQSRPERKFITAILIIALAVSLLATVSLVCFAENGYDTDPRLHRNLTRKASERRAARKAQEKKSEEAKHKDTSREDVSRLDDKIPSATVKITDVKITDQKYRTLEMERAREEAKLGEEKILGPVRPVPGRRVRSKGFLDDKEKKAKFFEVGFSAGEKE